MSMFIFGCFFFWDCVIFGSIPIGACEVWYFEISHRHGARVVLGRILWVWIDSSEANGIIRDPKLELENSHFTFDLVPLSYESVDVVVGENWLLRHKAEMVCHEKVVKMPWQEVWNDCRSCKVRVGSNGNLLWEASVLLGRKKVKEEKMYIKFSNNMEAEQRGSYLDVEGIKWNGRGGLLVRHDKMKVLMMDFMAKCRDCVVLQIIIVGLFNLMDRNLGLINSVNWYGPGLNIALAVVLLGAYSRRMWRGRLLALMVYQGPLSFKVYNDIENLTLTLNPYSWTKLANIIFMDVPAGVGYFHGETNEASVSNDQNMVTQATNFVKKIMETHSGIFDGSRNMDESNILYNRICTRCQQAASVKISHGAVQPFSPVNDIEPKPIFLN
ncbi:serine carboxypeptidase-like protein 16 [Tanacetum coccineum]